jgi:hypothetical protein
VWIGSITEKHLQTCPVETVHFSIYRDDGLDILPGGEEDLSALVQHFNSLHPNLEWEFKHGKEGAYLDLLVMLKDGKIETNIFTKSEPVYVGPTSCHDPKVFKSIFLLSSTYSVISSLYFPTRRNLVWCSDCLCVFSKSSCSFYPQHNTWPLGILTY